MLLRKFITYYRPHRKLFILDVVCALLLGALELVTPRFSSLFIDSVLPQQNFMLMIQWCLSLGAIFLCIVFLNYIVEYWGHILGVKMEYDMRREMFSHIQTLPVQFFDNHKTGKLMSRLVNDLNDIAEVAHHGPENLFISIMLLVGSFMMMYITNWKMALMLSILVPLMIFIGINRNLKFRKTFKRLRESLAEINAQAEDNFSGIRVVKAFANEEYEQNKFEEGNGNFKEAKTDSYKVMAEFRVVTKGFMYGIQLAVFLLGGYLIIQGDMTTGNLVEFMLYVQLFQQPIERISQLLMMSNQAMAGFERFQGILSIAPQGDKENAKDIQHVEGKIKFENVSFRYESDRKSNVLSNIDFTVEAGRTIAFVGPSGGGKTTLCSLIPRFYDIEQGRILLDGQDIRDITIQSLRAHIGIVQQDVFIFSGTIYDNIMYGRPDANKEDMIKAAKQADAYDFIKALPQGFDTEIGERGVKLSGGQKQRISLARMFLKNPEILILDEATSALDNQTEKLIQQTLNELSKDRTTLVVAHRLSTIEHADEIIVITQEGIQERGTHQQLLDQKGVYHKLYHAQI